MAGSLWVYLVLESAEEGVVDLLVLLKHTLLTTHETQGPAWWPLTAGLQQEGAGGGSDRGPSWSQHLKRERERQRSADEKKRF